MHVGEESVYICMPVGEELVYICMHVCVEGCRYMYMGCINLFYSISMIQAGRYMVDFGSTHCTPLQLQYFKVPLPGNLAYLT